MKFGRDLIIVALATFCLTSTLFMAATSRSADSPNWDPWADIREDGTVDIYDAITLANAFGSSGDTTKNVTIVGRANKLAYNDSTTLNAGGTYFSPLISVDGYSKLTVCLYFASNSNYYRLQTRHVGGFVFYADIQTNVTHDFIKTYDVPNQEISFYIANYDASPRNLVLDVYLIP